ncbi:hypothetical protein KUTeg_015959 [Tegillarca granosa]|uniref:Elongation of very long chain fatty acids protein n=1 Tax=Tegillarca granosa TaxID=220873 RepID=A0ABQ9EKP1_TEGGR|nr:hypothetical protein KUTeg_015959 [Tegillarca granosa]
MSNRLSVRLISWVDLLHSIHSSSDTCGRPMSNRPSVRYHGCYREHSTISIHMGNAVSTMTLLSEARRLYDNALSKGDPRVNDWLLMETPGPILAIFVLYLITVRQGPKLMEQQKPLQLNNVLIMYNIVLVGLSAYMFYEFTMTAILSGYSLSCQPVDYSENPLAIRMASVCWWYFFSKVIELLDTKTKRRQNRLAINQNKRVEDWLLMKTPLAITVIFVMYLAVVLAGPSIMKGRNPINLKLVLIPYNFALVILSVYMFHEFLVTSYKSNYSYRCQLVDYSDNPLAMRV